MGKSVQHYLIHSNDVWHKGLDTPLFLSQKVSIISFPPISALRFLLRFKDNPAFTLLRNHDHLTATDTLHYSQMESLVSLQQFLCFQSFESLFRPFSSLGGSFFQPKSLLTEILFIFPREPFTPLSISYIFSPYPEVLSP